MTPYAAEFLGTFWLVLGGCGSAVLARAFPALGIGFLGVALAFGLTVLTMAYAVGHISGGHFNPAVSIGAWAAGRFPSSRLLPYIMAQVLGGLVAGGVLYVIVSGQQGFDGVGRFAANGYGVHSPGGSSLFASLVTEIVMTMFFLLIILGATDRRAPQGSTTLLVMRARGHAIVFQWDALWLLAIAGVAAAGVDVFTLLAYERGLRISSSLIVGGTSTAIVLLVGFLALHEPVTPMRLFALALIACGIVLLQAQGG